MTRRPKPSDDEILRALYALRDSPVVCEARTFAAARPRRRGLVRPTTRWMAAAAVAAVGFAHFAPWPRPPEQMLGTRVGEVRSVRLEDGSRVILDTDTRLRMSVAGRTRRVELLSGRAAFQVAHDMSRPFRVAAGAMTVTAVGTAFEVMALPRRTSVTLMEGRVVINAEHPPKAGVRREADLRPGEQLSLGADGALSSRRPVSLDSALAWRALRVDVSDLTVAEAVAEMNRYSKVKLAVRNPTVSSRRISGVFRAGDVEALAAALAAYFELRVVERSGGRIVLA